MDQSKSECHGNWLHRYVITETFPEGVKERCTICKDTQFFNTNIPNYEYLSYHLRSALPREHKRFIKEYNK